MVGVGGFHTITCQENCDAAGISEKSLWEKYHLKQVSVYTCTYAILEY